MQDVMDVIPPPGYRLLELLGVGGMSRVYKAVQESTGQWVALKLMRMETLTTPSVIERRVRRFEQEARICAQIYHPNIVRLMDSGRVGDHLYSVFEYVPGQTLAELIAAQRPCPSTRHAASWPRSSTPSPRPMTPAWCIAI